MVLILRADGNLDELKREDVIKACRCYLLGEGLHEIEDRAGDEEVRILDVEEVVADVEEAVLIVVGECGYEAVIWNECYIYLFIE